MNSIVCVSLYTYIEIRRFTIKKKLKSKFLRSHLIVEFPKIIYKADDLIVLINFYDYCFELFTMTF